jgi:hypothetical protein
MSKPSSAILLIPEEKTIGDVTYKVTPLVATKGRKVFLRLLKAVSPAISSFGGFNSENIDSVLGAIGAALRQMDVSEEDFEYFIQTFTSTTRLVMPDGREPKLEDVFDTHFAQSYGTMFKWLYFCLEVNFGSIPKELGIEIKKNAPKEAPKAPEATP